MELPDLDQWNVCHVLRLERDHGDPDAMAYLLKSKEPRGEDGVGNPAFAVDLLLASGGKAIYRFTQLSGTPKYFVDDFLAIRDLTARGDRAVAFHSGQIGASDSWTREHVIYAAPGAIFAEDVAPDTFGDSWRHRHQWIVFRGMPLVLVAEPIEPASVADPHMCHSCAKYYQYWVYEWQPQRLSFILLESIQSLRDIGADDDPLQLDEPLIDRELAKRWKP